MEEKISYQQAQEAKEVLIKYLTTLIGYQEVIDFKENRNHSESLLLLALTQYNLLD